MTFTANSIIANLQPSVAPPPAAGARLTSAWNATGAPTIGRRARAFRMGSDLSKPILGRLQQSRTDDL